MHTTERPEQHLPTPNNCMPHYQHFNYKASPHSINIQYIILISRISVQNQTLTKFLNIPIALPIKIKYAYVVMYRLSCSCSYGPCCLN